MEAGTGPLRGFLVLDLARHAAGLYACMLMGDLGARVVRLEPPEGDPLRRDPAFRLWCRGRLSVALDVEAPEAREALERLVAAADVLVETWTPAEARARRLDYDTLAALNPRLVYCALPPFGEEGPLADVPGDDGVVAAYAGLYGDQGGRGQDPVFLRLPVPTYGAAFLAALGVASALYVRARTGRGQKVEASLYAGATAMQSGSRVDGPRVMTWARHLPGGQGPNPVYRAYPCSDGWIFIACGNHDFWAKLCIALGMEELVADPRYQGAPWNIPLEHRPPLEEAIGSRLAAGPREHWLRHLRGFDVPCAPVQTRVEFARHPQVVHNRALVAVDDPVLGETLQLGLPLAFSETPGRVGPPPPEAGRHTQELLAEVGIPEEEVSRLSRLREDGR